MKTYSRKRTEDADDVILNLDELCRLCLAKEEKLLPIFNESDPMPLIIRIMACLPLEVVENDNLPKMICHPCFYQLEKYYLFRKKCENSDLRLRRHLKTIKEKFPILNVNKDTNVKNEENAETSTKSQDSYNDVGILSSQKNNTSTSVEFIMDTSVNMVTEDGSGEDEPTDITLSTAAIERSAVTIVEQEEEELSENNEDPLTEGTKLLSKSICASLDNMTSGIESNAIYPSTVEVLTDDGTVIVMQLLNEYDLNQPQRQTTPPESHTITTRMNQQLYHRELCVFKERHKQPMVERGFTCQLCKKWFTSRSALKRHFRIHTGEKPFTCNECGRGFAQKEILKRHHLIHLDTRPFTCDRCGRGFTQREPLRRHLQSHAGCGEKQIFLHKCDHCHKVFCHPSGLSRHISSHTGHKFKCRFCPREFGDKSSLRRHMKVSHREELLPSGKSQTNTNFPLVSTP